MECVDKAVARQWCDKRMSAATSKHATAEELVEMMFSMQSVLSEDKQGKLVSCQPVASQQECEHENRAIFNVTICYQATTTEDTEDFFLFGLLDYWHCGHSWPIVPASGDSEDDCGEAAGM
jgi:hypothetical protein